MLLAGLLQLGESTPLFFSMPRTASTQAAAGDREETVSTMTVTDEGSGSSYAWNVPVDESSVLPAFTYKNAATASGDGSIGLGFDAPSIAIVGALTALCAAGLRRLIGKKVEVSSPWATLRFGGCALVAAAAVSPALNHFGTSGPGSVWFGIM
jgi:hypothetical protein